MTWRRRKVVARRPEPVQHGTSWELVLECGHRITRNGKRGARLQAAQCHRCQFPEVFGAPPQVTAL